MTQGGEETDEQFLEALKRQEFIISGQEIWNFIEGNTFFDELDMEDWFKDWLKKQSMVGELNNYDTECPMCEHPFSIYTEDTYVRL